MEKVLIGYTELRDLENVGQYSHSAAILSRFFLTPAIPRIAPSQLALCSN